MIFFCTTATAQIEKANVQVVFMEPGTTRQNVALPTFRLIKDAERLQTYTGWLNNGAAEWALDLYARAWKIAYPSMSSLPRYYIALVPGGNHARVGFQLSDPSDSGDFSQTTYIELESDPSVFTTTLLHETGHMILTMFNGGKEIPKRQIASILHTTSALTDRGTAFDEGFAIHLETLAAHFLNDPFIQDRYNHARFAFGVPSMLGEYHRVAGDLLTYAQTRTRYIEVRENNFAFAPAYQGPDYFRVQLEKTRNFAQLRNANQLLQSEGFYATFFFSYLLRGDSVPQNKVAERQEKLFETIAAMLTTVKTNADSPFLLHLVEALLKREGTEALDVLLDLSHCVFMENSASYLWKDHYLGALQMDVAEAQNTKIKKARNRWRTEALNDTGNLFSQIAPQLRVTVAGRTVLLKAFEEAAPLSFDLNTVEEGIIRMIPGISNAEVEMWMNQRSFKPFADAEDFRKRCRLSNKALRSIRF